MKKKDKVVFLEKDYFDRYYFSIKTGEADILIHRKGKQVALRAFKHYQSLGKEVEWKGKWTGNGFMETEQPIAAA